MAVETRSGRTPAKAAAKPAAAGASLAARRSHPAPSASAPSPGAEFGGAAGCALLVVLLPLVCHALVALCHPGGCAPVPLPWLAPPAGPAGGPGRPLSAAGVAAAAGWLAAVAALHVLLPGAAALGAPLRDGTRLAYKLNAVRVAAALAALLGCGLAAGLWSPRWVVAHFSELQGGALVVALALSVALHAAAARLPAGSPRRAEGCVVAAAAAAGGAPPSLVPLPVRFFLGAELNPRLGRLDLKQFCELQPGLLAWLFLDSCFAAVALEDAGWGPAALAARLLRLVPGSPPPPAPGAAAAPSAPFPAAVLLVLLFQLHYVCDAVWNEGAILTTMDITSDGFGFMLAFGDLVWVPFTYSLQLRYLQQQRPPPMGAALLGAVVALQGVGYAVFRGANGQKDAFRRDPSAPAVAHLVSIPTARGTRLLVSGWWGAARHVNYFGDWLMALAWCLPCGFGSALPYFYAAYFAVLLAHRERRDERHCAHKYGADWARYTALVPSRIVPYVY